MKMLNLALLFTCLAGILFSNAYAQDYPTKPIRLVIPFAPGGNPQ